MTGIPESTEEQLDRAIPARLRKRLLQGRFESREDIAALRSFVGLAQADFARAIEISVSLTVPSLALLGMLLAGSALYKLRRRATA